MDSYVTDKELLQLAQAARLPSDFAVRLAALLRAGGPQGPPGADGAPGPAPSGTGFVHVTSGVLDTPAELTGDVTGGASGVTTIGNDKVTFAKMQNINTARVLGRTTAGAGDPEELTGTQTTALLDVVAANKGLVPASPSDTTKFLRGDATPAWAVPFPTAVRLDSFGSGPDGNVTFDGSAVVLGLTPASSVYTLARDIMPANMTVNSGVTIKTNGWAIVGSGTLTNNGTIQDNGMDAVLNTPGTARTSNRYAGGGSGGSGGTGGSAVSNCPAGYRVASSAALGGAIGNPGSNGDVPGRGGGGGGGGAAGGGNAGVINAVNTFITPDDILRGRNVASAVYGTASGGGSGGGGGGAAGAGGAGGGYVTCWFPVIAGNGSFAVRGGHGGNGGVNTGGGGGGGGGFLQIVYVTNTSTCTASVVGGTGGTGNGTGAAGGNGAAGSNLVNNGGLGLNLSGDGT